jgi:hypothetical protein
VCTSAFGNPFLHSFLPFSTSFKGNREKCTPTERDTDSRWNRQMEPGTEPEKSLGGTELNCCSIKVHSTLYCIHFRLGEAIVGLHEI